MQTLTRTALAKHGSPETRPCHNTHCLRVEKETRNSVTGACEVHRALCAPELQRVGVYEIASRILPARNISGDFICTVPQGHRTIAVLGDLMGKGLSAAMWITHVIDLVHRAAEGCNPISDIMSNLNREIVNSRVRVPLTTAFAVAVEHATGKLSCTSAGHPPAILLRNNSISPLRDGGPLLGVFADARFESQSFELSPGDAVVAYSDGLFESHDEIRENVPLDCASSILAHSSQQNARGKLLAVLHASREFSSGRLPDDLSLLVVQRV